MKIIHITSNFPPHLGGMENAIKEIAELQSKKGNKVEVFTSDIGCEKNRLKSTRNLKIHYFNSFEFAHTPIIPKLFFKLLNIKDGIFHVHIAQAYIPEMVYLVSKLKRIPYIAHIHLDVDPSGFFGFLLSFYKKFILSLVLQNANKVICLTESQAYVIIKKYRLQRDRVVVVPNGVGNEYFQKKYFKTRNETQILFVGRLTIQKNVVCLIKAMSKMKHKVLLNIVGDGEQMFFLKESVKKLGLSNIIFHGKQNKQTIISFYNAADIFVLPSINEGLPLVLLEAMASGLPIIASNLLVLHDLLHNCGILVKPITSRNFALAINELIEDRNKQKILSHKSQEVAKKYNWNKIIKQLKIVYENFQKI